MNGIGRRFCSIAARTVGMLACALAVVATPSAAAARTVSTTPVPSGGAAYAEAMVARPIASPGLSAVAGTPQTADRFAAVPDVRLVRVGAGARADTSARSLPAAANDLTALRLDEVALVSALALEGTPFSEARSAPFATGPVADRIGRGLPLPEPDGWAAVAATIALALFFFLRRLS